MPLIQMQLKIVPARRCFLSKENRPYARINNEKLKNTKKCLFGQSNPEDTSKLLDEQIQNDRQRFLERFGIDIDAIENNGFERVSKKRKSTEGVLKPHNKQSRITDVYQITKTAQSQPVSKDKE